MRVAEPAGGVPGAGAGSGPAAPAIAVVGLACRYPDADDPEQLWENVLAGRRAFRRIPPERLAPAYQGEGVDQTYATHAAVLRGFAFDRSVFRVPGPAYRQADPTHWLALRVAAECLEHAGYPGAARLDRDRVAVVLGNSLTGEFSRANLLRLRWPYVARGAARALAAAGVDAGTAAAVLASFEADFTRPFPEMGEESLAGGLSNTIAGRICNHFDLHGGGYTVDGACASSLLAVTTGCASLAAGDVDLVLAGGVDLSLDPFELAGFARTGALARGEMLVYDEDSRGFIPGEGCGLVALMRAEDAAEAGRTIYALIRGWGISSDGRGGLTRPAVSGQATALRRAYRRAGFGPDAVGLFEGHGTGTPVGDAVELEAIELIRRTATGAPPPAAIGTVKANIGHTKAAAGAAGLIKAVLSLHHQVLPPTTGCRTPHPILRRPGATLHVPAEPLPWTDPVRRAAVSAMGFGGINTHVVLEGATPSVRHRLSARERLLARPAPATDLVPVAAASRGELAERLGTLARLARRLSRAELADLAATLGARPAGAAPVRAALLAADPDELAATATAAAGLLDRLPAGRLGVAGGALVGDGVAGRVTLLFPGQGAPVPAGPGALAAVAGLDGVRRWFDPAPPAVPGDDARRDEGADEGARRGGRRDGGLGPVADTSVAQRAIISASLAALAWLDRLGLAARAAIGHSLGELTALTWAKAVTAEAVVEFAAVRGQIMSGRGRPGTGMLALAAGPATARALTAGTGLTIAAYNGPASCVVGGDLDELDRVRRRAADAGVGARRLPVSHAFHSPAMAACADEVHAHLKTMVFARPVRRVVSTVTGAVVTDDDLVELLTRQITDPVRFADAVEVLRPDTDLFVEAGPGGTLAALLDGTPPVVSVEAGGISAASLARVAGALFAAGAVEATGPWRAPGFHRPLDLDATLTFLASPCETGAGPEEAGTPGPVPLVGAAATPMITDPPAGAATSPAAGLEGAGPLYGEPAGAPGSPTGARTAAPPTAGGTEQTVVELVAAALELPAGAISADQRLLADLHLNSLRVSQLALDAADRHGRARPVEPLALADATVAELAAAVAALPTLDGPEPAGDPVAGVAPWVALFEPVLLPEPGVATGPISAQVPSPTSAPAAHPPSAPAVPPPPGAVVVDITGAGAGAAAAAGGDEGVAELVAAARRLGPRGHLVVVSPDDAVSGFLRTLVLESPERSVTLLRMPDPPARSDRAPAPRSDRGPAPDPAALAAPYPPGYHEIHLDGAGRRLVPGLRPLRAPAAPAGGTEPIGPGDTVLIAGGGKGIGALIARHLAATRGVRVALLGRSAPGDDAELAANLAELAARGAGFGYERADLRDASAVRDAVRRLAARLGPPRAVVHSAAVNRPARFELLSDAEVAAHLEPKTVGLDNLLAALPEPPRLVWTFGSVIGRFGLAGEAHYALANGMLGRRAARYARAHPGVVVRHVEWSVWSGAGMAERLGVVDQLTRAGVGAIPPDDGLALVDELLAGPAPAGGVAVVAAGRLGPVQPGARPDARPAAGGADPGGASGAGSRFTQRVLVDYPGIELVTEAALDPGGPDARLDDHVIDGVRVLPAVIGLEAMSQVAAALLGRADRPTITDARFARPVIVPDGGRVVRIAALARDARTVEAVVRSDETGYAADHFRARLVFGDPVPLTLVPARRPPTPVVMDGAVLYETVSFHRGAFRRLIGFTELEATRCVARIRGDAAGAAEWFGPAAPPLLGSPAVLDTAIHVLQACVPHRRVLPVGAEEVRVLDPGAREIVVEAVETAHEGAEYRYDVTGYGPGGRPALLWRGLRLREVAPLPAPDPWPMPLLAPYLRRAAGGLLGAALTVTIARRPRSGPPAVPPPGASASHLGPWRLSVGGPGRVACDWEPAPAGRDWSGLLGGHTRLAAEIARVAGEPVPVASARVWTALECLSKAGRAPGSAPLVLDGVYDEGFVLLRCGGVRIASVALAVAGTPGRTAVAIAVEEGR